MNITRKIRGGVHLGNAEITKEKFKFSRRYKFVIWI